MTIATIFLFLAETFSSFPFSSFFYEPISTQSFELYRHGHTPWNYQSYATVVCLLNSFEIRYTFIPFLYARCERDIFISEWRQLNYSVYFLFFFILSYFH